MTTKTDLLTYSELITLPDYSERLRYLQLWNHPHQAAHAISNPFYKSRAWRMIREEVIRRDAGCDLGILGAYIDGPIFVHHMNPLEPKDIEDWSDYMIDPEYLITVSEETHNKIHYGKIHPEDIPIERSEGDTKLW